MTPVDPHLKRSPGTEQEHPAPWLRFVGTWKLVETRAKLTEDGEEEPYGSDSLGYITYTDDGYMHAIALAQDTKSDLETVAYAGTWNVDGNEISHHVTASVVRDWIGTDQVRTYEFFDNRLTLTMHYPGDQYIRLVWQKTESHFPEGSLLEAL